MGWLALGIASVVLAAIAAVILRSERESNAIIHHLELLSVNLQRVFSDLADAQAAEREYLLTGRPGIMEGFERSRAAVSVEFERLLALVKHKPSERQQVERVRDLVQQELDQLQSAIGSRTAAPSRADFAATLTDRARKLTEMIRVITGRIDEEHENVLAQVGRTSVRLTGALAAVSGALLLAAFYVLIGQVMIARSVSSRRRTEEALRASEYRFETLCEHAPVGIYQTDAQGLCAYVNPQWSQMSGLSAAENLGLGWAKALHPEDRDAVIAGWKTTAMKGASWEFRLLTQHGESRWIRALGSPIISTKGEVTGYVGTAEDITERKLAQEALQEREALNRAILNSLPANIAVLDAGGRIQAINQEWQHFAEANGGCPAYGVGIGVNYLATCDRAAKAGSLDAVKAHEGIHGVLAGKLRSFRMEYPCHSATEARWFRMIVTPLAGVTTGGVVIIHVDITENKQAKDTLREALQQLQPSPITYQLV